MTRTLLKNKDQYELKQLNDMMKLEALGLSHMQYGGLDKLLCMLSQINVELFEFL